ncbi:MAG: arginine N-succinyltransferase [Sandaracinaceae bacterium]
MRFEIRAACAHDTDELLSLAAHLDSVNLPHDRDEIASILDLSERSFAGAIRDPRQRQYVFLLRDAEQGRPVGTSMILAQLGSREAPYIFFDVRREERYSATLDRHFVHRILTIGFSYHGPTEIGGLVVHPDYRLVPQRLGRMVSYVRFLFLATHRPDFQERVLAELMPPLLPDGTSHLWEAVGRHFTGLSYREADRLSKKNKEFIRGLFPSGDIYTSLLPPAAQEVIGQVGPQTLGVAKMLTRIGFRYRERVDPFDGGPHYMAPTDEIELVLRTREAQVEAGEPGAAGGPALVAVERDARPYFRAVGCRVEGRDGRFDAVRIAGDGRAHLDVGPGDSVAVLPLA